eukprot:TRINITY_DN6671_c0_g3_i3.p1 TRINITY_DN6671_c0_g3~~TRINITY_DN6671_c0_g3_i3.p1  ORF type:complete len:166 (-),score=12.25 TRINITY_DN6671_c0_g3_i3:469-966(-)
MGLVSFSWRWLFLACCLYASGDFSARAATLLTSSGSTGPTVQRRKSRFKWRRKLYRGSPSRYRSAGRHASDLSTGREVLQHGDISLIQEAQPPPPTTQAPFVYGGLGIDACPTGYEPIRDEQTCEIASQHLGDPYSANHNDGANIRHLSCMVGWETPFAMAIRVA